MPLAEGDAKKMLILFDDEGDDKIDMTQIGTVARALGLKPTEEQVEKAVGKEIKRGERVGMDVFWPAAQKLEKEKDVGTVADFVEALSVFDKEENGKIHVSELRHAFIGVGERLTKDEASKICEGAGDPEGMVKYSDFVKKVLAGPQ